MERDASNLGAMQIDNMPRFSLKNYAAASIEKDKIDELAGSNNIRKIWLDRERYPLLDVSVREISALKSASKLSPFSPVISLALLSFIK